MSLFQCIAGISGWLMVLCFTEPEDVFAIAVSSDFSVEITGASEQWLSLNGGRFLLGFPLKYSATSGGSSSNSSSAYAGSADAGDVPDDGASWSGYGAASGNSGPPTAASAARKAKRLAAMKPAPVDKHTRHAACSVCFHDDGGDLVRGRLRCAVCARSVGCVVVCRCVFGASLPWIVCMTAA